MHAKFKTPLDVMAVMADKDSRSAEVIDVECIYLESLQVFMDRHIAQICLRIGGCDSKGKFHPSNEHNEQIVRMNIADPLFSELFTDVKGNLKLTLTENDVERIYEQGILGGDQLVWKLQKGTEIELENGNGPKKSLLKK